MNGKLALSQELLGLTRRKILSQSLPNHFDKRRNEQVFFEEGEDFRKNRQYTSMGNAIANERLASKKSKQRRTSLKIDNQSAPMEPKTNEPPKRNDEDFSDRLGKEFPSPKIDDEDLVEWDRFGKEYVVQLNVVSEKDSC